MPEVSNTQMCRLFLLLTNGGLFILREILLKFINNRNLDSFLKPFKLALKSIILDKELFVILFPHSGNSDIEKWDITLLATVLIHCCTLETKVNIRKLKETLDQEVYRKHGDIKSFLNDEKTKQKINLVRDKLTDYQYEMLFPKSVVPFPVDDWGVELLLRVLTSTKTSDMICREMRKIITTQVTKDAMVNELPKLETFLCKYQTKLRDEQSGNISENQFEKIFPNSTPLDMHNWDTDTLLFVVLGLWDSLSQSTINGIKKIKKWRNKLSHPSSTSMKPDKFQKKWNDFYTTFEELVKDEVPSKLDKFKEIVEQCTLDLNPNRGDVAAIRKETRSTLISATKDLGEKMQPMVGTDEYTRKDDADKKEVHIEIRIDAPNEKLEKETETRLKDLLKNNDESVQYLLDMIPVKDIQSGSVLLIVNYSSLQELHNIINFICSDELQIHLDNVASTITLYQEETVAMTACIPWPWLKKIESDIESPFKEAESKCKQWTRRSKANIITNSVNLLTNHEMNEGFRLLSEKLSKELDSDLTLYPVLDSRLFESKFTSGAIDEHKVTKGRSSNWHLAGHDKCETDLSSMIPKTRFNRKSELDKIKGTTMGQETDSLIVVTLDIGDTYSGYAYMYRNEFIDDGWKIHMNDPWSWEKHVTNKTSTTLFLKPHGKVDGAKYGYDAEMDFSNKYLDGEHKEYLLFKHIKKEFYKDGVSLESSIVDINSGKKKPLCDIMLMMLRYFKMAAIERIQKTFDFVKEDEIFWVIPVPAAWRLETRMLYRDLMIESGISHRMLKVVTEPEASLAYTMQFIRKKVDREQRKHISDVISLFDARVLVLDLSGDAMTISVHRVSGDKTFKMVFQSRSQKKGSNQVNDQFLLFLSNVIGEDIIRTLENDYLEDYQTMCSEFEMRKREINPNTPDDEWFTFKFPHQIEETFQEQYGSEYKTIRLRISAKIHYVNRVKYERDRLSVTIGVLKELFYTVLDKIAVHIRNVMEMPKCARIVSFVLVGGFSQSKLVQQGIQERFEDQEVIVPIDPELAIMKGAIIMKLTPDPRPPTPLLGFSRQKTNMNMAENIHSQVSAVCAIL